jgi:hypothetical protein
MERMLAQKTRPATACERIAGPLAEILDELRLVVGTLSPDAYGVRMGEVFADATIGSHVRHCLDHVRAVVDGRIAGVIDYDHRNRGTAVETDPAEALAEIGRLSIGVRALQAAAAADPVSVAVMPTRDGECALLGSTLGRELAFVLSHTIHHNATVRGMVRTLGCQVPTNFGYAPSTLAHRDRCACAR